MLQQLSTYAPGTRVMVDGRVAPVGERDLAVEWRAVGRPPEVLEAARALVARLEVEVKRG